MAAVLGVALGRDTLILTRGRDFRWAFECVDEHDNPIDYPPGELFIELLVDGAPLRWLFTISGALAQVKAESEVADLIPAGTPWQLVWLPAGELSGGDPLALGVVKVQAPRKAG